MTLLCQRQTTLLAKNFSEFWGYVLRISRFGLHVSRLVRIEHRALSR
jgi:hypothetical protein